MKKIKTFENFLDTRPDTVMNPEMDQSMQLDVRNYVDDILNGDKFKQLFDLLGREIPGESDKVAFDAAFDEVRDLAISHFIKNPEEMVDRDVDITNMVVDGGDGIPRLNNVGGVINEDKYDDDFKFDRAEDDADEVDITLSDAISAMIEETVNTGDIKTKEGFIQAYLKDDTEDTEIIGLINDSDVYEFYLKYRIEVDEVLNKIDFFDEAPSSDNIFGVYDYIVYATKFAVKNVVTNL